MPAPVRTLLFPRWAMHTPLRILAVDNEPSVTLSLRYVFADPRYELACVNNGNAALARLDANSELFGAIRKRGIKGKIIVVSAHLSSELSEAYERMDVHVMFSKPFNVDELRSAVD